MSSTTPRALFALSFALICNSLPVSAADDTVRIRGTIERVEGPVYVVKNRDGAELKLTVTDNPCQRRARLVRALCPSGSMAEPKDKVAGRPSRPALPQGVIDAHPVSQLPQLPTRRAKPRCPTGLPAPPGGRAT